MEEEKLEGSEAERKHGGRLGAARRGRVNGADVHVEEMRKMAAPRRARLPGSSSIPDGCTAACSTD
jgi:hypothetical protein